MRRPATRGPAIPWSIFFDGQADQRGAQFGDVVADAARPVVAVAARAGDGIAESAGADHDGFCATLFVEVAEFSFEREFGAVFFEAQDARERHQNAAGFLKFSNERINNVGAAAAFGVEAIIAFELALDAVLREHLDHIVV